MALLLLMVCSSAAQELDVAYLEYPPYMYTEDGRFEGILADATREVMDEAGIDANYKVLPAKRILTLMMAGEKLCAIGAFRTPGRESYAWFSDVTYQNSPLAVIHRSSDERFDKKRTLTDILDDPDLVMGKMYGYSLGSMLDHEINMRVRRVREVTADLQQFLRMIEIDRVDYAFFSPEGIRGLMATSGTEPGSLEWFIPEGMPEGQTRHIICSLSVPKDVRKRINDAVNKVEFPRWQDVIN